MLFAAAWCACGDRISQLLCQLSYAPTAGTGRRLRTKIIASNPISCSRVLGNRHIPLTCSPATSSLINVVASMEDRKCRTDDLSVPVFLVKTGVMESTFASNNQVACCRGYCKINLPAWVRYGERLGVRLRDTFLLQAFPSTCELLAGRCASQFRLL